MFLKSPRSRAKKDAQRFNLEARPENIHALLTRKDGILYFADGDDLPNRVVLKFEFSRKVHTHQFPVLIDENYHIIVNRDEITSSREMYHALAYAYAIISQHGKKVEDRKIREIISDYPDETRVHKAARAYAEALTNIVMPVQVNIRKDNHAPESATHQHLSGQSL